MQLTLENKFASYYPPKAQLLKWIGNKQRFAVEITKHFPVDHKRYFEPFLGSGAILATIAPARGFASDAFPPLMEIWHGLARDPKVVVDWYRERRRLIGSLTKEEVYDRIRDSYNSRPNGPDFLYLSRSCYGGIVRFRKSDGKMSTPCGAHTPISVESFEKRALEWNRRIRNVVFAQCDFVDAFKETRSGDLVYCDPPYSDSQSILYGAQAFDLGRLFSEIEKAKSRGVKVALSLDGSKKSGKRMVGFEFPTGVFVQ